MRTLSAGLDAMRTRPTALLPASIQGIVLGLAMGLGALPDGGSAAAAGAAFPMDVYFDLKQAVAFAPGWIWFAVLLFASVVVRGAILATTVWLGEEDRRPFREHLLVGFKLTATAAAVLFPTAALFFITVATRYAPFGYCAAAIGVLSAAWLVGRMTTSFAEHPRSSPGLSSVLGYGYLIAASAAVLAILSERSTWLGGAFLALMGPVHAITLLGWRARSRTTEEDRTWVAVGATLIIFTALFADSLIDRAIRTPGAAPEVGGYLFLLSGADSASDAGSLFTFDQRAVGFPPARSELLSYSGAGEPYDASDTRRNLDRTAKVVARQIESHIPPPRRLVLGHSQAGQVLDRIDARGLTDPEAAAVVSAPPAFAPPVSVPDPDEFGAGRVGGDLARAFSWLLGSSGLGTYDVDSPASPTQQGEVLVEPSFPRLSVWALADSVWLTGDWRHPGHLNVVAFSDHVGALNDPGAVGAVRRFFAGEIVGQDDLSWRGSLVSTLRYTFEPWRPR